MKIKKNIVFFLAIMFLVLLMLTACSAKTPAAGQTSGPEQAPAVTGQQEQAQASVQAPEIPASPEAAAQPVPPAAAAVEAPAKPAAETPAVPAADVVAAPAAAAIEDKTALRIEGAGVEKPVALSLEELKSMKDSTVEAEYFSLNSYGTKAYFHFKGVKLSALLEKAGLKEDAERITVMASDGYKLELSKEQALKEDYIDEQDPAKKYPVIIAWNENGQDYDPSEGYPYRLVIGQKEAGDVNKPNWVMNVSVITVD